MFLTVTASKEINDIRNDHTVALTNISRKIETMDSSLEKNSVCQQLLPLTKARSKTLKIVYGMKKTKLKKPISFFNMVSVAKKNSLLIKY